MENQQLKEAQHSYDKDCERGEALQKLANEIEQDILSEPLTTSQNIDAEHFTNTVATLIYALPDDDTELGLHVRQLYRDEVRKAANRQSGLTPVTLEKIAVKVREIDPSNFGDIT